MAQSGETVFSLQPSEMVKCLEAKLNEASIDLKPKQRQALEGNQAYGSPAIICQVVLIRVTFSQLSLEFVLRISNVRCLAVLLTDLLTFSNRIKNITGEELLLLLGSSYELTQMRFTMGERVAIKHIVHSLQQCYVLRATYFGAKQHKGIRASVFKNAQTHNAYYYPVQSKSIWYDDGDDMKITLLFKEKEHAMKFQNFLTMWYIENLMVVKSKDVSVEKELKVMYVEKC